MAEMETGRILFKNNLQLYVIQNLNNLGFSPAYFQNFVDKWHKIRRLKCLKLDYQGFGKNVVSS